MKTNKLNSTCFSSNTVRLNILKACHIALKDGHAYVQNRKGENYLKVKLVKDNKGKNKFLILDKNQENKADSLARSLLKYNVNFAFQYFFNMYIAYNFELIKRG